jgi:hypothetical protein
MMRLTMAYEQRDVVVVVRLISLGQPTLVELRFEAETAVLVGVMIGWVSVVVVGLADESLV